MGSEKVLSQWQRPKFSEDKTLTSSVLSSEQREREYSPSSVVGGDYAPFLNAYRQRSDSARAACSVTANNYTDIGPRDQIDLTVPTTTRGASDVPLVVFIHGGYWQELSKHDSFFAAEDFIQQDVAFAAIGYTLAPRADIRQIVDECRQSIRWLHDRAEHYGYDSQQIHVIGSSAGAHLAAMVAGPASRHLEHWPGYLPAGLVLVSGIYDLEPLVGTSINDALKMSAEDARAHSPLSHQTDCFPPTLVAWGEIETDTFKRQSKAFANALAAADVPVQAFEVAGMNHFNVMLGLGDPMDALGCEVAQLIDAIGRGPD